MSEIRRHYEKYVDDFGMFRAFHNEVINMPRNHFDDTGLQKVRMWAGYLLLTENRLPVGGVNYKTTLAHIARELADGNAPKYRDMAMERRYFEYEDLDTHYSVGEGRMFRHVMGMCAFFGFVTSRTKQKKVFNYDKCREYYLSEDAIITPVARNNLVMLNARDNDFIRSLSGIQITAETDYRPTYAILRYAQDIGRPVTEFELAVLLGRIDALKTEAAILARAMAVGQTLPCTQREQVPFFFEQMGWQQGGDQFTYANSQAPQFKFHNYLLFMRDFGLLQPGPLNGTLTPTQYALDLLADDVPYEVADLERLLAAIDDYEGGNRELNDLILYRRNPELLRMVKADAQFLLKMNWRSLNRPQYGRDGRRRRNPLIAELAKVLADDMCQYENRHIFTMPNGRHYCEAHHVIEFSTEDGPDIVNNMVALGPAAHMILHHACADDRNDVYSQLKANGALDYARFKEMAEVYRCLTPAHVEVLHSKHIVTNMQKAELLALIGAP